MSVVGVAPDEVASSLIYRNEAAVIFWVDEANPHVLGWTSEELMGMPTAELIHPDDQASAISAWFEMIAAPGSTRTWRGRYRSADGSWVWIQTVNTNRLDEPDSPRVETVMTRIVAMKMSVEEELRARKQLLSRLTEALPVGVFQVDGNARICFTHDRFHEILGVPAADSVSEQFAGLVEEDRGRLDRAVLEVLGNQPVDDLEVRFDLAGPHPEMVVTRVCQISLRPLTDSVEAVSGAIGCLSDVTDSVELRRQLEYRATVDGLTGCLNRSASLEVLDQFLDPTADRVGCGLAVLFIDLDGFKGVNDQFGHAAGDRALMVAADRIRQVVGDDGLVGRLGGDEFLVVLPEAADVDAAWPIALRIRDALHEPLVLGGDTIPLGASIGLAWADCGSPESLIARADQTMYRSKLLGLGTVVVAR